MAIRKTFAVLEVGDNEDSDNYTDYVYDNKHTFCDDDGIGLQAFHAVFQPVLYSLIFLLGVAGNGLMITILLRRWRRLRITEIYLLHLALSDLMLLLTFPFDIVENAAGWLFGEFLCRLMGLVQNLNLYCGSFLLACIGFDRYLAIVHAIPSMQSRRPRTKSNAKQGAIRLALLVTLVFFFCWLPYNITLLITTLGDLEVINYENCTSYDLVQPVLDVTKSIGLSHCCLNPFLYAFVGVRFRNELIKLLCQMGCSWVCLPFMRAQGHSRPSISDGGLTSSNILI
ncbi:hypothetical protein NQZ68_013074 [Dissostichus eleginoides]|nr:hypothetical protein NQZ68_013074 [Dissostichus eleginoides]